MRKSVKSRKNKKGTRRRVKTIKNIKRGGGLPFYAMFAFACYMVKSYSDMKTATQRRDAAAIAKVKTEKQLKEAVDGFLEENQKMEEVVASTIHAHDAVTELQLPENQHKVYFVLEKGKIVIYFHKDMAERGKLMKSGQKEESELVRSIPLEKIALDKEFWKHIKNGECPTELKQSYLEI